MLHRSRRPTLSAGALHPISVLLFDESCVYRINAESRLLETLTFPKEIHNTWTARCHAILPHANGMFLALVADLARPRIVDLLWESGGR